MISLTKNKSQNQKFLYSLQTRRLVESFASLNSSLAQSAKELCCWQDNKKLLVLGQFQSTNILYPGSKHVNHENQFYTLQ